MSQTTPLIDTLKRELKAHGFTYADVAKVLDLSTASVKRLLSEQNLSLQRLDRICAMLDMEISDLVQKMNESARQTDQLTEAQEQEIASDRVLLVVAVCVLNRWSMADVLRHFYIDAHQCIQKLARLDRLKLIELLPGNRIKLRVAPNFAWRPDGPIQRFFQESIGREFFQTRFELQHERLICLNGTLSDAAATTFHRKMERLAREFDELNADEAALPVDDRHGVTVVLAVRGWGYGMFSDLNRKYSGAQSAKR